MLKIWFLAKLYRTIFEEDNMNFYMGAGAGLLTLEMAELITQDLNWEALLVESFSGWFLV